jgi:hypothetical protein
MVLPRLPSLAAALSVLAVLAGCSADQWGLPRIHLSARSPDGKYVALVRNHPNIDPPDQSLHVETTAGTNLWARRLSGDQDWCHVVAWSADSRTVAFLVQDARLLVVDAATGRLRLDRWLADQDGYPPSHVVTDLSLSADGASARFQVCRRSGGKCSDWRVEPIAKK